MIGVVRALLGMAVPDRRNNPNAERRNASSDAREPLASHASCGIASRRTRSAAYPILFRMPGRRTAKR